MRKYNKVDPSKVFTVARTDAILNFPSKYKAEKYFKSMQDKGVKGGLWMMFIGSNKKLS